MLFMLGVLLVMLFGLTVLVRALLLFPLRGVRQGWAPALRRYALSLLLCATVGLWQLGELYGFSWQHMGRADRARMVDAAVAFAYPGVYADLGELRRDYSRFTPEVEYVRYQGDMVDLLFGGTDYRVRLPDLFVELDIHGQPLSQFALDEEQGAVAPDRPELGLIGEVFDERPISMGEGFQLRWAQPERGEAEIHGHCFIAYSEKARRQTLELTGSGAAPLLLKRLPGFYHVQVQLVPEAEYHYSQAQWQRITRAEFVRLRKDCRTSTQAIRP